MVRIWIKTVPGPLPPPPPLYILEDGCRGKAKCHRNGPNIIIWFCVCFSCKTVYCDKKGLLCALNILKKWILKRKLPRAEKTETTSHYCWRVKSSLKLFWMEIAWGGIPPHATHWLATRWSGAAAQWSDLYLFWQKPVLTLLGRDQSSFTLPAPEFISYFQTLRHKRRLKKKSVGMCRLFTYTTVDIEEMC